MMKFDIFRTIEVLERTPAVFRSLLNGLSDDWLLPGEGPGTFSAFDNIAHVVHADRTKLDSARPPDSPEFGTVRLRELLATWAVHDLSHVGQTARVLAKQYREAVGPWSALLPLLGR